MMHINCVYYIHIVINKIQNLFAIIKVLKIVHTVDNSCVVLFWIT